MPNKFIDNTCKVCGARFHFCSSCDLSLMPFKEFNCCTDTCWIKSEEFIKEFVSIACDDFDEVAVESALEYKQKILDRTK